MKESIYIKVTLIDCASVIDLEYIVSEPCMRKDRL